MRRLLRRLPPLVVLALAPALLASGAAGCFSPAEPPCAFSCLDPSRRCPESYTCGTDGICHREGATTQCVLTPPADAALPDRDGGGDAPD